MKFLLGILLFMGGIAVGMLYSLQPESSYLDSILSVLFQVSRIAAFPVAVIALIKSQSHVKNQDENGKRQNIFHLWDYIINLNKIYDADGKFIPAQARKAINALELVAHCWYSDIIDKKMIAYAFGENYMMFCNDIKNIRHNLEHDEKYSNKDISDWEGYLSVHMQKVYDEIHSILEGNHGR